jgi:tetratricopeptide (TPR) repeat protein
MVTLLDEIRLRWVDDRFDDPQADLDYARAFREYGIDVDRLGAAAAVERIRARGIRVELAGALDRWALVRRRTRPRNAPPWKKLLAVARRADPDPWRNRFRAALEKTNLRALRRLAGSAPVRDLPPVTLANLANALQRLGADRVAVDLLRRAQAHHPGDFWINLDLGLSLLGLEPPQPAEALRYMTVAAALRPQSPGAQVNLAVALGANGRFEESITACRQAIRLQPTSARAYNNLGLALEGQKQRDAAVAALQEAAGPVPNFARVAVRLVKVGPDRKRPDAVLAAFHKAIRLRPNFPVAYSNLGTVLQRRGKLDAAAAAYRQALRLRPRYLRAYNNLANLLAGRNQLDAAIGVCRKVIRLQPENADAQELLGFFYYRKDRPGAAIAHFRTAIRHRPNSPQCHFNIGFILRNQGRLEEALPAFREAVRLRPDHAAFRYELAATLSGRGEWEAALAQYDEAIRLEPGFAQAHCNRGQVLKSLGEFTGALKAYRRGHELGSLDSNWPYPSALWVKRCERLVELNCRLPALLKGEAKPGGAAECLELAQLCRLKRLYGAAAKFYSGAFNAQPALSMNLHSGHRYQAACAAARAGCGRGKEAGPADARGAARRQALDWLRADLAAWARHLQTGPPRVRAIARRVLGRWQRDPAFDDLRDPNWLAQLPPAEQDGWRRLWADVAALLPPTRGKK